MITEFKYKIIGPVPEGLANSVYICDLLKQETKRGRTGKFETVVQLRILAKEEEVNAG